MFTITYNGYIPGYSNNPYCICRRFSFKMQELQIPPKLLLEIVEQISIPLATVFNLSLKEGMVPLEWKEANIIPLFKKGSRNKSENYRPVSLTSVICKLLERLIKDHLVDFLVKNKLINPSQHGFLKARSCLTNMLCFLEDVTKWLDEGSPVDIIYLDF